MSVWQLPVHAVIGGICYPLHADYRDVLEILVDVYGDRFEYEGEIPEKDQQEATAYLAWFVRGGTEEETQPGAKLLDWEQDAPLIAADINKAAGQEIRAMAFLHWWTFLAWFHGIGQGQLSAVVTILDKLHRGKKLESWEKEYRASARGRKL